MRLISAAKAPPDLHLPPADRQTLFLSACWLESVRATAPRTSRLYLLADGQQVHALLGCRRIVRHRLLPVRQWYLNETGDAAFDRIALEYNGFAGLKDNTTASMDVFRWLLANLADADELVVRNATATTAAALRAAAAEAGWQVRRTNWAPAAVLNLAPVRQAGGDLLAMLGRNTRAAIRRSIRLYEAAGPIRLNRAESAGQALDWFARLERLHVAAWEGRAPQNAFTNPYFRPFHEALIAAAWPQGHVDLLRVSAGEQDIGYLYNLTAGGWTMAYQSGLAPAADNRWKPGLVCHAAAIGFGLERGDDAYDFLAGPARYKASLSNQEIPMESLVAFAPKWHLRLEDTVRRLKRTATIPG